MLQRYDRKQGIACDLVHWRCLPRELVERSVRLIPRRHLSAIFSRLSRNIGANRSGFPDLVLFSQERTGSYEVVEVKGPGDQLQANQRRWLRFFQQNAIPFRVARIKWRG